MWEETKCEETKLWTKSMKHDTMYRKPSRHMQNLQRCINSHFSVNTCEGPDYTPHFLFNSTEYCTTTTKDHQGTEKTWTRPGTLWDSKQFILLTHHENKSFMKASLTSVCIIHPTSSFLSSASCVMSPCYGVRWMSRFSHAVPLYGLWNKSFDFQL